MISFSDFISALQKIIAHEYGWQYIVAVATVIVAVLISCNWTYLNTGYRGPGVPKSINHERKALPAGEIVSTCTGPFLMMPAEGVREIWNGWNYVVDANLNGPVIVLPTLHGFILGHGKLLLVDDSITRRDLLWPSARTFFLAVYPEDAFQAMISVGSPLLETLTNPGPTWANPKDIRDFEEMAWTMRQSFGKSRARSKAT
ncbi:hypothetical protein EYR41_008853 [Orbilia oligospora]|uniref:Uncharacterized protein n=1 Tax=Orbilia oligospora TaxID=2813651 RepID=A0A8H2HQ62_ORBOL|nr:hypothetical protein EYR41_008853 [Orbilia oligospora]